MPKKSITPTMVGLENITIPRLFGIVLLFTSLVSSAAWQGELAPEPHGATLNDTVHLTLDFSLSDYLLVTASQSYADFSISLKDASTDKVIKIVSFPWHKGLDEVLLVHKSECVECRVELNAVSLADQSSQYSLTSKNMDGVEGSSLKFLEHLSDAGVSRHQASSSQDPAQRNLQLRNTVKHLEAAGGAADPYWRHHALALLAETYSYLGDTEKNILIWERLLEETKGTQSVFRVLALYEYAASVSDVLEERALYDEGMAISQSTSKPRLYAIGANYRAVGLVREARFTEAITDLTEARDILAKSQRWRDLVYPLHNLGWANQRAGNLPASIRVATEQKILAERYQLKDGMVLANYNFAMTYGLLGDVSVAEDFLDTAIEQHSKLPISSSLSKVMGAFLMKEKAQKLLHYGAFDAAEDYATSMVSRLSELGYPGRSADAQFILGEVAFAQGHIEQARDIYTRVINYDRANNRQRDTARHLLRLVELEMSQSNFVSAAPNLSEALGLLSSTEDYRTLARAFSMAIELQLRLGGKDEAKKLLDRTKAFIGLHSLDIERAVFEYRQALVARAIQKNSQALNHLHEARSQIEKTLPKIRRRDLRQSYLALQKSVFELNLLLMPNTSSGWQEQLALIETYRARTLAEQIGVLNEDSAKGSSLFLKRDAVLDLIQGSAETWHKSPNKKSVEAELKRVRQLGESLEKIEVAINSLRLNESSVVEPITFDMLPSVGPDELIAYYFVGKDRSWLWSVTSQGGRAYPLPAEKVLTEHVDALMSQLVLAPSARTQGAWEQLSATKALSQLLLQPLISELSQQGIKRLTIIPDGPLNNLSFATLLLPESDLPLVSKLPLAYAPSLLVKQALDARLSRRSRAEWSSILVAADPKLDGGSTAPLKAIEFSRYEAQEIRGIAKDRVTILLAEDANKLKVIAEASKSYSILHFATHGLLNRTEPLMSGLVFSSDRSNKNLWLAAEISRARLSANLVVLSACESSAGRYLAGEGLFSLSRAFIEGGAGQVIGTLWKVQDKATASLLKHFYKNLLDRNLTVAQSLSEAQMAVYLSSENDWRDPYYWAGFQLQGGGENTAYAFND